MAKSKSKAPVTPEPAPAAAPIELIPLPAYLHNNSSAFEDLRAAVESARNLVRYLILHGVFCVDDLSELHECIEAMAHGSADYERAYEAFQRIARGLPAEVDEAGTTLMLEYGEAGYLLGLAVGLELSRDTLLGGAR